MRERERSTVREREREQEKGLREKHTPAEQGALHGLDLRTFGLGPKPKALN